MSFKDQVIIVTGGANGIGEGLVRRFVREGAKTVVIADRDAQRGKQLAQELSAVEFMMCDVSDERNVHEVVDETVRKHGRVDFFASNAGIHFAPEGYSKGLMAHSAAQWERIMRINVTSHVFAIQALLPHFKRQSSGGGFLITASAAGLLSDISDASYATTKHAAVGLAESIRIAHHDDGVRVFCLCPQAVDTDMSKMANDEKNIAAQDGMLSVEQVVDCVIAAVDKGEFMILPHPIVGQYLKGKAADYNRWIGGMTKWRRSML